MGTLGLFPVPGIEKDSTQCTASVMKQVAALLKDECGRTEITTSTSSSIKLPLLVIDVNVREVFWPDTPIDSMKRKIIDFAVGADIIKLTDMVTIQRYMDDVYHASSN